MDNRQMEPYEEYPDANDIESIAEGLTPYGDNTLKNKYLSFRACGFSIRESERLANCTQRTVERWRAQDEEFRRLDTQGVSELRKSLAKEYVFSEFLRNFRLVLEKDAKVLAKSLAKPKLNDRGEMVDPLSKEEHEYLRKIRGMYSAQQLEAVRLALMSAEERKAAGGVSAQFNFTQFVMDLRKEPAARVIDGG